MSDDAPNLTLLTVELAGAYLSNNSMEADAVPAFIAATHAALKRLDAPEASEPQPEEHAPAVSVRKSLASRDHILSLIDGKPYKTLTRHLQRHGLTPAQYRERYKLKADYPMVAPSYSEHRRSLAQTIGLGRRVKAAATAVSETVAGVAHAVTDPKPPRKPRKPAAAASGDKTSATDTKPARKPRPSKAAAGEPAKPRRRKATTAPS